LAPTKSRVERDFTVFGANADAGVRDCICRWRRLAADSPIRYHAAMSDFRFAVRFGAHCRGDAHAARRAR
jgi:hypothetical protein